ncbi:MAG: MerR family transcriptional regulator [Muribaculaceae bacterium]|nr:MerR family transcriptional regulator [Muribaculaceae bacterium]
MIKNKLKIKEFSLLCQVTVKTLRHYEKLGLLKPNEVDEWTGYRYYDVSQMQTLMSIKRLKSMGFSLDEIASLMASSNHNPSIDALNAKIDECKELLAQLTRRLDMLQSLVDSQNKIIDMEKFSIESLPQIIVASHREVIKSYAQIGPMCYEKNRSRNGTSGLCVLRAGLLLYR